MDTEVTRTGLGEVVDPDEALWHITKTWGEIAFDAEDPDGWLSAYVKRDGCVELWRYFNEPRGEESDNIHICDLDELIERLQALRRLKLRVLGDD